LQFLHGFLGLPYTASPSVTLSNPKNTVNHSEFFLRFQYSIEPLEQSLSRQDAKAQSDAPCHFDPFGKLRVNSGRNLS
jgi:hypothetical protein